MGYEIRYGPKISQKRKTVGLLPIAAAVVVVLALGVRTLFPDAAVKAWQLILPADTETQAAFQTMVDSVRAGEAFGEAVTAFCQEIIENAELPDAA